MSEIHGSIFVIVGLFMSIISYIISNQLKLFILVGIVLLIYGIFKLYLTRPSTPKKQKTIDSNSNLNPYTYCPRCGVKLSYNMSYCPNCGFKLKL